MVKVSFSSDSVAITRRSLLTGAVASTSALVLAACGGTSEAGPVPTVTRVPAEGAPPTPTPAPPPGATPAGGAATPAEGAATPEAGAATPEAGAATPAAGGAGAAVGPLIAFDIGWELNGVRTPADAITLTVTPGTTFELVSEGAADHDFTVDELSLHVPVAPGETVEVTIPEDAAPGEYEFYCSVPGHRQAGMVGTLVVQEAAAAPAAAEESAASENAPATQEATAETVGPLIAFDIGWELDGARTPTDAITLTVAPGTTFEMVSEGAAEHDFTVDKLSVHVPVAPGETVEVTIPEDAAPGEYEFYCSVPGHRQAGMFGTLVVQEAGAAPAAAEETATAETSPAPEAGAAEAVGPLIAFDIGWELDGVRTPDPVTLTVAPGTTFEMVSEGAAEHDFTVDALSVHVPVAPGETVEVTIPDDAAAGEYEFYCSVPGHRAAGMFGTLVVE